VGCRVGWPVGMVGLTVGGFGPAPKVGDCVGVNDGAPIKEVGAKLYVGATLWDAANVGGEVSWR
jgi:hypothetical protein